MRITPAATTSSMRRSPSVARSRTCSGRLACRHCSTRQPSIRTISRRSGRGLPGRRTASHGASLTRLRAGHDPHPAGAECSRRRRRRCGLDGDRTFEVLHLPGHAPSSIGLFERATGVLFSGESIYDSTLIDALHHSTWSTTSRRCSGLRELPVRIVHAGHDASFGRERLMELAEAYLIEKAAL